MDDNIHKWWSTWAPIWEYIENRHFSTTIVNFIINDLIAPVLIIGAGQGLIVRYLNEQKIEAIGLDINKNMIDIAKKKYNLDLVLGDAKNLPFSNHSFNSVIISSGVVDYGADEHTINHIIKEAKRVCLPTGHLFTAFYQLNDKIEKFYKRIGVIDSDNQQRIKRIFEIDRITKKNPIMGMIPIMKWTKKSIFRLLIEWPIIGLTIPEELYNERDRITKIFKIGESMGITEQMLLDSIPDKIPYRTRHDIEYLFNKLDIDYKTIIKFEDCILVQIS